MDEINEEIVTLQNKIKLLEEKQQNMHLEQNSVELNLNKINNVLNEKKKAISMNSYKKSLPLARFYDQQLVGYLEAIYNTLLLLNTRIEKLEQS